MNFVFRFQKENATSLLLWHEIFSVVLIGLKDEMDIVGKQKQNFDCFLLYNIISTNLSKP